MYLRKAPNSSRYNIELLLYYMRYIFEYKNYC
jgi:hypothetical protein